MRWELGAGSWERWETPPSQKKGGKTYNFILCAYKNSDENSLMKTHTF